MRDESIITLMHQLREVEVNSEVKGDMESGRLDREMFTRIHSTVTAEDWNDDEKEIMHRFEDAMRQVGDDRPNHEIWSDAFLDAREIVMGIQEESNDDTSDVIAEMAALRTAPLSVNGYMEEARMRAERKVAEEKARVKVR